jgi:hypothetical protein
VRSARAPRLLLATTIALAAAAGWVVADGGRAPGRAAASREFQSLVGGLGLGPALDLSECGHAFDPRLAATCARGTAPVVGGATRCPHHGGFLPPP